MKKILSLPILALLPGVAFAQTAGVTGLPYLIQQLAGLISALFPIAIAVGVLAFFYEIIMFIINKDNKDKADGFKKGIFYSLLALFLMFTFFGILKVIANTLGLSGAVGASVNSTDIPRVNF